jgi:SAM-dependent methyltransferase
MSAFYSEYDERGRLGPSSMELLRTRQLLSEWLPNPPADVLDVGGAAGIHALWLAQKGYDVDLVDLLPKHVAQAEAASATSSHALRSIRLADARDLDKADASFDVVLLLGPLYHLTDLHDRRRALAEAWRVLRPGGLLVAAAIGRWASTGDGLTRGFLAEEAFADIVAHDVASGVHENPTGDARWFTTAFFHTPDQLAGEVTEAGFAVDGPVAVEGPFPAHETLLDGADGQVRAMAAIQRLERDPTVMGASPHLLVAGYKSPS